MRRLARGVLWAFFALVIAILLLGGLWAARVPHKHLIPALASRALGATVELYGLRLYPILRAERIAIVDPESGLSLLSAEDVACEVYWSFGAPRQFGALTAQVVDLNRVVYEDGSSNLDWFFSAEETAPAPAAPSPDRTEPDPLDALNPFLRFVPEKTNILSLSVRNEEPGRAISAAGLLVDLAIDSTDAFRVTVGGNATVLSWTAPGRDTEQTLSGALKVAASRNYDEAHFALAAHAENEIHVDAHAAVFRERESPHMTIPGHGAPSAYVRDDITVNVKADSWLGPRIAELLATTLEAPLTFQRADLGPAQLTCQYDGDRFVVAKADTTGRIAATVIGDPDNPDYTGDIAWSGTGTLTEDNPFAGRVTLAQGQAVTVTAHGDSKQFHVEFNTGAWPRDKVLPLMPAAYREAAAGREDWSEAAARGHFVWRDGPYTCDITVAPTTTAAKPFTFAFQGEGNIGAPGPLFDGTATASLETETIRFTAKLGQNDSYSAEVDIPAIALAPWLDLVAGPDHGVDGAAAGRLFLFRGADPPANVEATLTLDALTVAENDLTRGAPLSLSLDGRSNDDFDSVERINLALKRDDLTAFTIAGGAYEVETGIATGHLSGTLGLEYAGALLDLPELWGESKISGPFRYDGRIVSVTLDASADPIGHGDLINPYGMPLSIDGAVSLQPETAEISSERLRLALGENTVVTFDAIAVGPKRDDYRVSTKRAALTTDFAAIVALGYLAEATGNATLEARDLAGTGSDWTGAFDYDLSAARLALPEAGGAFERVAVSGNLSRAEAFAGDGALAADSGLIAGVELEGMRATVRGENDSVYLEDIEARALNGLLKARLELRPLEENMPVTLSTVLQNIDLARFTAEFQPPDVTLTGEVRGDASLSADLATGELTDVAVDLRTAGGFSINREMVEQILPSEYFEEEGFAGRQLSKIVQKTIGDAPQRAFDRATLTLGFEGGRITGRAKLESKDLNLTVDIKADPEAIVEVIRARQKERVGARASAGESVQ